MKITADDIDYESVVVYKDTHHGLFGSQPSPYGYRFGITTKDHRTVPLDVRVDHPQFSGRDIHPCTMDPHHHPTTMFGSMDMVDEGKIQNMINGLAQKVKIQIDSHYFITMDTSVWSTECKAYLPHSRCTVDSLLCADVKGIEFRPIFRLIDSKWVCICKILGACI